MEKTPKVTVSGTDTVPIKHKKTPSSPHILDYSKTSSSDKERENEKVLVSSPETEQEPPRWLVLSLQILAYGIPLTFLAYVLYINYLPFGYDKTFTIDVGSMNDTDSSLPFYLEPSRDLSERKVAEDGTTYRELDGIAYAVFNPDVVLKDAEITVSVEGEDVSIIPPVTDFDPDSIEWDYEWDFTQGKTPEELGLVGEAFPFDGAMYFDGGSRLELPDSADKFEDGAFTVYAEWTPENDYDDSQQIVGHFNWEILQHAEGVSFQVGRMNSADGQFYRIYHKVTSDFFNRKHSLIAVYSPSTSSSTNGYISLFIDDNLSAIKHISSDKIWTEYNGNTNISAGKSNHGGSLYFKGLLSDIRFTTNDQTLQDNYGFFVTSEHIFPVSTLVLSTTDTRLHKIYVYVKK